MSARPVCQATGLKYSTLAVGCQPTAGPNARTCPAGASAGGSRGNRRKGLAVKIQRSWVLQLPGRSAEWKWPTKEQAALAGGVGASAGQGHVKFRPESLKVFVAVAPCDLRKGLNGLLCAGERSGWRRPAPGGVVCLQPTGVIRGSRSFFWAMVGRFAV